MMSKIKSALLAASAGAVAFQFGGCGFGGGNEWFFRMLGDAVGDTLAYNVFLD